MKFVLSDEVDKNEKPKSVYLRKSYSGNVEVIVDGYIVFVLTTEARAAVVDNGLSLNGISFDKGDI